uniref:Uncharacterized protein n=1 Tax=Hucho hucho TaxID=62062 RepID=A0A4W5KBR6_9TELE
MDERRIKCLAEGYSQFADVEKKVLPIISKCLDGISMAGRNTNGKQDSLRFIEQHKSGFERPAEVDFEDYSQGIKPASSDANLNQPKIRTKLWPFSHKKTKVCTLHTTPYTLTYIRLNHPKIHTKLWPFSHKNKVYTSTLCPAHYTLHRQKSTFFGPTSFYFNKMRI